MCHFITAILPKEADTPGLDVIARKHHRQFEPLSNLSIEAQLILASAISSQLSDTATVALLLALALATNRKIHAIIVRGSSSCELRDGVKQRSRVGSNRSSR